MPFEQMREIPSAARRYVDAVNSFDVEAVLVPEELILTNYIVTREDLIAALFIVFNKS